MRLKWFEERLAELPLVQYAFLKPGELTFTERVRAVCRQECPMYGRSWSCPPAVGSVAECAARCQSFPRCLMIATAAELSDAADPEQTRAALAPHEALTGQVRSLLLEAGASEVYALSARACTLCERCAWLEKKPCRHPEQLFPCVESHGILVTALAELTGTELLPESGVICWFSLLFFRESDAP